LHRFSWALVALALAAALAGCGSVDDNKGDACPSFDDSQLLPEVGGADSEFVLWIQLNDSEANRHLDSVIAQLFFADGRSANKTFDLVRVEDDPLKYLRTFTGAEACSIGTCTLYFHVIAEHEDGCQRSRDTQLFQVVMDQGDDDSQ
jgi:hypothetical protein